MKNIICKNDNLFFEMFDKALKAGDSDAANKVQVALTAFINEPVKQVQRQIQAAKIQAVSASTDFEQLITNSFNVTVQEDNFDLGYERVYRSVPLDPQRDFWEIYNVDNGLSFRLVEEGGRIPVEPMSGDKVTVYVDYFGGALGWTDKMMRFRKIAPMIDMAMIFRNRFWTNKANNHYLLLATAAAGNVTAWAGAAADGQLRRDIQTINAAAFTLGNRNKDKGYGDTASARLVIYANPQDKARINAALAATVNNTLGVPQSVGTKVDWNVEVIYTFNANITAGTPIMVLPYNKIQRADAMQPTTYNSPKDPLTLNQLQSVWAIYGAAVADTDQCEEFTLG